MEDPTLAPQEIYQKLYQLSGDQYFGRENRELEQLLREAINSYGGLAEVDALMAESDPGHSKPSKFNIDWSWLTAGDL